MPQAPKLPPAVRALLEAGWSLANKSSAARVSLARLDGIVNPDGLPELVRAAVAREIARAVRETCDPMSSKDVDKALKRAWGESPRKVLDDFEEEPVAVGPHAQVHRGVLDGKQVAIKVARPGVASTTRSDLALLETLAAPARAAFPAVDPGGMIHEVKERVLDELDLEHEAGVQRAAGRALRGVDGVSVASIESEHTTDDVRVTEFVEGRSLADPQALDGADRGALAHTLVRVYGGSARSAGLVFANPRANDIVLRPDGGLVLLDVGAARTVETDRMDATADALAALRNDDPDAFATALAKLGVLDEETARRAHALVRELGADLLEGPFKLHHALLAERGEQALDRLDDLLAIATRARPDPREIWPARMLGQLIPILADLEVEQDWAALALAALREGFDA